jgi:D-alanine transfer protein
MKSRLLAALYAVLLLVAMYLGVCLGLKAMVACFGNPSENAIRNSYSAMTGKKFGLLALQQKIASRKDVLVLRGSSELGTAFIPANPVNVFETGSAGFEVDMEGLGYYQSLYHAIALAALGRQNKAPTAFIVSSQWFAAPAGVDPAAFESRFSEALFTKALLNRELPLALRKEIAGRVISLLSDSGSFRDTKDFAKRFIAYADRKFPDIFTFPLSLPIESEMIFLRDKKETYDYVRTLNCAPVAVTSTGIHWDEELAKNLSDIQTKCTTNEYGIYDEYYNVHIKKDFASLKNYPGYRNMQYRNSVEYSDFNTLLSVCSRLQLDPLFIIAPVNGKWYDYCGADRGERTAYYVRIRSNIEAMRFRCFDMSPMDYTQYTLCDVMHLGWKGWLAIDKRLVEEYQQNR